MKLVSAGDYLLSEHASLIFNRFADARALFERLVLKFAPDKARPVWDLWAKHEYTYGDLAACQKMEARFAEAYPSGKLDSVDCPDSATDRPP